MGDFEHMGLESWASAGRNQYLQSPVQVAKGANLLPAIVVRLGIGVKTVESHRSQPMPELGIRDTTSLVVVLHQEIPDAVLRL